MELVIKLIKDRINPVWLLCLCYLIVAWVIYLQFGVKIVNDSKRYLDYAANLNQGFYFDPHNFWYFGYVAFIFIVRLISSDTEVIIFFQYAFSFLAIILLYKTSILLFSNKLLGFLTSFFYIFILEIITWNSYILPEAIYASALITSFYLIIKPDKSIFLNIITLILVLFTALIKPTGFVLIVSILIVIGGNLVIKNRLVRYTISVLLGALFLVMLNKMLTTFILIENYLTGEIVYDLTTLPNHPDLKLLTVDVPDDLYIPAKTLDPLARLVLFVIFNPIYMIKLSFLKVLLFLSHIRPYWSTAHNLFIVLMLYPLYSFGFKGFSFLNRDYKRFTIIFFLGHLLIIACTTVDWDGRFLLPLMPLLFLVGGSGIVAFFKEKGLAYARS